MPEISRFYGVIILMFIDDHDPPHIHVRYCGQTTKISIDGKKVKGPLPRRYLKIVLQWMDEHRDELIDNWRKLQNHQDPDPVKPFEK